MLKFRILTKDNRIKFAGIGENSWFTLEQARKKVNYSNGETIYEYDNDHNKLWEIF